MAEVEADVDAMPDRLEPGDPQQIGEFWLSGRLGAGGQGVVYDAYGPDGGRVAIKVLHGAEDSPGELERMAAEARAAQRVASFCTARILQVRLEPPRPFIVSEYIDGQSLQAAVAGTGGRPGRRFGGDDLHRLGIGIITALTTIHQARVVHRDLKPGNVMLGPDGPRLIDFGIARVLDTHSATGSGFAGTLRYMAPEVYAGQRAGAEADVFAWGAIMVFAATGEHAFGGGTLPEIAHRIRTHDPDLTALPDALRPLVASALAKDPLARPSARAILAALTRDPNEGADDLDGLVAAGVAQAGPHTRWEPGDPALGKVAEDAYTALPPRERDLVPEVFLRCVVPGEDGSLATRPVPVAELADRQEQGESQAMERVVRAFHPLLVVAGGQVVLARPALLRAWPRLRDWVEDERAGLAAHHRLRQAARTWDDHGRRRGDVLTGARLDEAVHWATAGRRQSLNRLERGLLDASTRAQTARARRVRAVAVAMAVTTVLSLAATGWAVKAQRTTVQQRDIAAARQLAALSGQFGAAAPDKAALLAVAAQSIRETPESRAALLTLVTKPARGVLSGYKGDPVAVAADRGGRLLAIGNADGTVALWDVRAHRQVGGFLRLLTPSSGSLPLSVAVSPDGRTLAAAASEVTDTPRGEEVKRAVRLWDVRTRRPLGDLPVTARPNSLVFTPDGKSVAVDDGEGVALWDVRTLSRRGPGVPHSTNNNPDGFTVIAPGAATVATGTVVGGPGPTTLRVWDLNTGRPRKSFPVKGTAVALSPDGRTVVTRETRDPDQGEGFDVYLWDTQTGRQRGGRIPLPSGGEVGPFSPDGRVVVIGTQLWEAGGTHVGTIATDVGGLLGVAAFAGESTVVSLDGDGSRKTVRLWDVTVHQPDHRPFAAGRRIGIPPGDEGPQVQGASPDGRTLITYDSESGGSFRGWDVATGKEKAPAVPMPADTAGSTGVSRVVVAPDGKTFATGNDYGQVRIWDPAARRWFGTDGAHAGSVSAMAFSPDGRFLATGGGVQSQGTETSVDGKVHLWDMKKDALVTKEPLIATGSGESDGVTALAFSPDGKTLAVGVDQTAQLWDVSGRKQRGRPISGLTTEVNALAFGPDNTTLAIGTTRTAVLWNVRDRRQVGTPLTGHTGRVTSLAFSPDGGTLATGGDDEVVKLWDTAGQSQIGAPLAGHTGPVTALAFGRDAASLTTGDNAATVRRWNIAMPANPAATACAIAGRTLTRAEWAQYVPPGIGYRDVCGTA
ncbi:WD40 repeat domain-containing serine/threonine protein kinase [Actinomadura madurae]|uniref:WD40 repeat domain-containing serine/threonine protein kinase n=1 Tax=Actinomadura madurae TaxID=1993 RepID=UPI00094551BE|nr:protein kinase [Actinomadura madurae]